MMKFFNDAFWAIAGAAARLFILGILISLAGIGHLCGTIAAAAILICFEMGVRK